MAISKKKISALPAASSLSGLFTIGVNAANQSVKISLAWLSTAYTSVVNATTAANTAANLANDAAQAINDQLNNKIDGGTA